MKSKARWRCIFNGAPSRDVYAYSKDGATKTAIFAQRLVGFPKGQQKPLSVQFVCFVGHDASEAAQP